MPRSKWHQFQEDVAALFRQMGGTVSTDALVHGVRANHRLDVWVQFEQFGIRFRWIVECKYWQTKIPKEKVNALKSVVEDIGADRGFLVTERGFQPAAKAAAFKTNVTLASLSQLREAARADIVNTTLQKLRTRVAVVLAEAHSLTIFEYQEDSGGGFSATSRVPPGVDPRVFIGTLGRLSFLQSLLDRAVIGDTRLFIPPDLDDPGTPRTLSMEEFLSAAPGVIASAEDFLKDVKR